MRHPLERIPETMLAVQVVEYKKPYKIHQVPTPKRSDLAPHELIIKVAVASYCHTDSLVVNGVFQTELPCIASHEGAGVVVAVAIDSEAHSPWKIGDRVMAAIQGDKCGKCSDCKGPADRRQYCPYNKKGITGITTDGAFAEYMVVDGRESSKIPDAVPFTAAAPLACAGCTVYRALRETNAKPGEWIALVGSGGGLGHIGIRLGKAMGFKILGVDARDIGLSLTKSSGADAVVDARQGEDAVVKEVAAITGDRGKFSGVKCAVTLADGGEALACAITEMHGTMIQVAQPPKVSIPFNHFIFRDIKVKGSLHAARVTSQEMLDLVAEKGIQIETVEFKGLEEVPKLQELVKSGGLRGKAIVVVDENLL